MKTSVPRSCDRCHAIKERCEWSPGSVTCRRCNRLRHVCKSVRPQKPPGRRPQLYPQTPPEREPSITLCSTPAVAGDVTTDELRVIDRMIASDDGIERFLMGPTFSENHRQLIMAQIVMSAVKLKDALMASSMAWTNDETDANESYRKASSAIQYLSMFEIHDVADVSTCITLGAMLHTFALKLRVDDVFVICTQTLERIKPIYESRPHIEPSKIFLLTCLVLGEIFECLLRCQVPPLRYKPPADHNYVDRFAGFCGTLLPLLHDICELSHALSFADDSDQDAIMTALSAVERTVIDWIPPVPSGFMASFTAIEMAHMLCQAQAMQTAALLVIHRLRHPYGVADEPALAMAAAIMRQLEMTRQVTGRKVNCVDLAILVACFEFQVSERSLWEQKIPALIGYSVEHKTRVQGIIRSFWTARDSGQILYWYNLGPALSYRE